MKNLIIVLSVILAVSTTTSAQTATKSSKEVSQKITYTCPMHADQVSMKAGNCGKCEMKLVKTTSLKHNPAVKGSQASTVVVAKYVCTMDGATSDKPGKCPKCGMDMSKNETPKADYACPMHPKVTGNKGDNCSKCGMDLVEIATKKTEHNHQH